MIRMSVFCLDLGGFNVGQTQVTNKQGLFFGKAA